MSTIKTGTTLTTAYQVEGDTTGALVIQTGGTPTTAVTVGSDQNVTVAGNITLNNGAADGAQLTLSSSGYSDWNWDNYSGRLRAYYGSTEYFTINSSGNVGIGTSSPTQKLTVSGSISLTGDVLTGDNKAIGFGSNAYFLGNSASSFLAAYTAGTERMRIDSSGNLLVGTTTTPTGATGSSFYTNISGKWPLNTRGWDRGLSVILGGAEGYAAYFERNQNSSIANCGYIYLSSNNTTTYATSSDYRLKENVQPMTGALGKVAQLKPCTYTWKADGSSGDGFIAHELQEVCPQAVHGVKDAVREDGTPEYQGIDTSFLVATLTAAIQEQQVIIESLKTRIETLENK